MSEGKKAFPQRTIAVPWLVEAALPLVGLLVLAGCAGGSKSSTVARAVTTPEAIAALTAELTNGASQCARAIPGDALAELDAEQKARFEEGKAAFLEGETAEDGIGPVFNGLSCGECHKQGALGGAAFDTLVSVVTRIGGTDHGQYSDFSSMGGPVIQRRSLQEFNPDYPIPPESVPSEAQYVSRRTTTPLFGAGLIEAIPETTLLRLADPDDRDRDGISGRVNRVWNPETNKQEIGRFGWKAQVSTLNVFSADAYLNEMGITSPLFPKENPPQGKPIPLDADLVAEPEDDEDVQLFAEFMRFLAPPYPREKNSQTERGAQVFQSLGCVSCHVPALATGQNVTASLSHKVVPLYSDLLVHDMGKDLSDGIQQGEASGGEFRTAPLWGLSQRAFFLHDGRATTVEGAIQMHGGEASAARTRFLKLSAEDREDLLAFLKSL